jgi:hypothetical protein
MVMVTVRPDAVGVAVAPAVGVGVGLVVTTTKSSPQDVSITAAARHATYESSLIETSQPGGV